MTMLNSTGITTSRRYRLAREAAGLKQEELAEIVGVSRTTIGDWERGLTEPAFSKLVTLARATNQPLDWFAEGLDSGARPEGLEPPTFWLVATDCFWTPDRVAEWLAIQCQAYLDAGSHDAEGVA